ncbi:hypothetical protein NC796_09660 [Aliifodinibius sp. S!AR15-10]|uniref:hypothetical protein n=1 Tax=Aliifodinibius sp. S!AR15-10 TaxID=2950437 RepID=UPI0028662CEE|nr:hypothetical protein [Aliifodinibius sp. S!AR15-10]MDR8391404.1 hypothetical protein [Aliifodinibius sp. S!AR15-10]
MYYSDELIGIIRREGFQQTINCSLKQARFIMKTILSLVLLILLTNTTFGQEGNTTKGTCDNIEGAWEFVSATIIYPDSTVVVDASQRKSLKLVTPTHWMFISKSPETGELTGGGGKHSTTGNTHTVEREYHSNPMALEAGPTPYECRIEGDTWYHSGQIEELQLEEVWQRIE